MASRSPSFGTGCTWVQHPPTSCAGSSTGRCGFGWSYTDPCSRWCRSPRVMWRPALPRAAAGFARGAATLFWRVPTTPSAGQWTPQTLPKIPLPRSLRPSPPPPSMAPRCPVGLPMRTLASSRSRATRIVRAATRLRQPWPRVSAATCCPASVSSSPGTCGHERPTGAGFSRGGAPMSAAHGRATWT